MWTHEFVNMWMLIAGIILYYWYPNQITSGWWAVQCPVTAYTTAVTGTASVTEVAVNGWTRDLCLSASPIYQMTTLSWFMILYYSVSTFVYGVNAIWFRSGGLVHEMWLRWFQFSIFAPMINLCLLFWVQTSYGMKQ